MPKPLSIRSYRLTDHARLEMSRRQVGEAEIAQVLAEPEQVELDRPGRMIFQSRVYVADPPKTCLLRVFVDIEREPPDVVTVYRTSKVEKYWRHDYESNL